MNECWKSYCDIANGIRPLHLPLARKMNEFSILVQCSFNFPKVNNISLSPSQTLSGMSEYCSPLLEGCQKNRQRWKCLAEECEKGLGNGFM